MTVRETTMTAIAVFLVIIVGVIMNWDFTNLLLNESIVSYFLITAIIGSLIYGFKPC